MDSFFHPEKPKRNVCIHSINKNLSQSDMERIFLLKSKKGRNGKKNSHPWEMIPMDERTQKYTHTFTEIENKKC